MLNRYVPFLFTLFLFICVLNISSSSQTIVGEFGDFKITLDEFEYAYSKNVGGWEEAEKEGRVFESEIPLR